MRAKMKHEQVTGNFNAQTHRM